MMEQVKKSSEMMTEKSNDINILLLGETGAGKSTTINALANYLKYSSFEEALNSLENFTELVPVSFILTNRETGEPWLIKSAFDDDNERHGDGHSVTQAPVEYMFHYKEYRVRIIDTPGVGDTRGIQEDGIIFDKIFDYIQHYKQLNAILFVVKGNETRKTPAFKYCITEMFTHLHKSVCHNVMFCFTFCRNTNYGPGDGFLVVKSFLDNELGGDLLTLIHKENCFFVDNEAFRFMIAKKQKFSFEQKQENRYRESWDESTQQIEFMFSRIFSLRPHELNRTIYLNLERKNIIDLAQPMIQIEKSISENIEYIKQQQSQLEESIKNKDILNSSLYIMTNQVKADEVKAPVTMCINESCAKLIGKDGQEMKYAQMKQIVCHDHCACLFVTESLPGQRFLKFCKVFRLEKFGFGSATCKECGCSWRHHMHFYSVYEKVSIKILNADVEKKIQTSKEAIQQTKNIIEQAQQLIQEYKEEKNIIETIMAKFDYTLSESSVFATYKYFDQYFQYLIQTESEANIVSQLKQMKDDHRKNVIKLRNEIKDNVKEAKIEEVSVLIDQLLNLKHSGQSIRQILDTRKSIVEKYFNNSEKQILGNIEGEKVSINVKNSQSEPDCNQSETVTKL